MPEEVKLSKTEHIKENSRQLRGTIAEELEQDTDRFSEEALQVLKHHGSYQQDNRDQRGGGAKVYSCMVRSRIPGGKLTAEQFLGELDLCDRFGNGTLRVTTRQSFQLHGILKRNIKETIREINRVKLSTISACGDVSRNTICCPAPYKHDTIHDQMQADADRLANHLRPRSTAYYEIWLEDENGQKTDVTEFKPVEEPIYGSAYLPRKFKTAFALCDDNCIDVYANDLGFIAVVEGGRLIGYNIVVGGSMGVTPAQKKTFPAIAKRMTFITPDEVLGLAEAVVKVQRDFGNRSDRKQARMKYLIANWGLPKFKQKVEEYYGRSLPEPHPSDVTGVDDHLGWQEQGDGKLFLGIYVDNGRIKDEGDYRMKTGLRTLLETYRMPCRLTTMQNVILWDIDPAAREEISRLLSDHGIRAAEELTPTRRLSMACPALPTCGLSVTESERVMPQIMDQIEAEMARYGLSSERLAVHMTGCPNGCARPYTPDIGLVGKAKLKYTMLLGGNREGTRMASLYKDLVPIDEIGATLSPLFLYYKTERLPGESFGDFCNRKGNDDLAAYAEQSALRATA